MTPELREYREQVSREMQRRYGIDCDDAGVDDESLERFMQYGDTPEELVRWWGEKYDLDPVEDLYSLFYGRPRQPNEP